MPVDRSPDRRQHRQRRVCHSRPCASFGSGSYDVAIDLQGLLKSAVLARLSGAKRVIGFPRAAPARASRAAVLYGNGGRTGASRHRQESLGPEGTWGPRAGRRVSARGSKSGDRGGRASRASESVRTNASRSSIPARHGRTSDGRRCISPRSRARLPRATTCGRSCCGGRPKSRSRNDVVAASDGTAAVSPPTTHRRSRVADESGGADDFRRYGTDARRWRRRHAARRHFRSDRSASQRTVGRGRPGRSRDFDACSCHYQRRCRIAGWCLLDISPREVMELVDRRLARV